MTLRMDQIMINRCYQTTAGEVRHVTSIAAAGDLTFTSHDVLERREPIRDKQMSLKTFAEEADREVPCPAG